MGKELIVTIGGTSGGSRWSDQSEQQDCLNHQQRRRPATRRHRSLLNLLLRSQKKIEFGKVTSVNVNPCLPNLTPLPPTNSPQNTSTSFHLNRLFLIPLNRHQMLSFQNPLHFKVVVEIITTDYTKLDLLLDIPGLVLAAASKSTLRLPFPCKLNNIFPRESLCVDSECGTMNLTCLQIHHSLEHDDGTVGRFYIERADLGAVAVMNLVAFFFGNVSSTGRTFFDSGYIQFYPL